MLPGVRSDAQVERTMERERQAMINPYKLAKILVRHCIIDPCAVSDPEGYDGGRMLGLIRQAAKSLEETTVEPGRVLHSFTLPLAPEQQEAVKWEWERHGNFCYAIFGQPKWSVEANSFTLVKFGVLDSDLARRVSEVLKSAGHKP